MSKARKSPFTMVAVPDLEKRQAACLAKGFGRLKWVDFCIAVSKMGLKVGVYEAQTTRSKYVYVIGATGKQFKVRFSNHRPNASVQLKNDSDFYVGVSNGQCTTTDDALVEVRLRFAQELAA